MRRRDFLKSFAAAAAMTPTLGRRALGQNFPAGGASPRQTPAVDFVGGYLWGTIPNSDNPVAYANGKMSDLGMTGVRRIVIAPVQFNPLGRLRQDGQPGPPPLCEAVLWPENAQVFRSNKTVIVTVYPTALFRSDGTALYRLDPADLPADEWETARSAARSELWTAMWTVRATFPDTKVIWTNWELDNDCPDFGWERGLHVQQDRVDVARDVRETVAAWQVPGSGEVHAGVEFNHVFAGYVPPYWDPAWGPKPEPRKYSGFRQALTLRGEFFLGYSMWEAIATYNRDPEGQFDALKKALAEIRSGCAEVGIGSSDPNEPICGGRFFGGEVGRLRDWDDLKSSVLGGYLRILYDEGAAWAIVWVGFDQPGEVVCSSTAGVCVDQTQFGVFDRDGGDTVLTDSVRAWMLNGLPPVPSSVDLTSGPASGQTLATIARQPYRLPAPGFISRPHQPIIP